MASRCCILLCRNSSTNNKQPDREVQYFPFPEDLQIRTKWIEFVGTTENKFRWRSKHICSNHFLPEEVKPVLSVVAVPTIFSETDEEIWFSEYLQETTQEEVLQETEIPEENTIIDVRTLYCRLCLQRKERLFPLSMPVQHATVEEILFTIYGIMPERCSYLPKQLCSKCLQDVTTAFNVQLGFERVEEDVKSILGSYLSTVEQKSYMLRAEDRLRQTYPEMLKDVVELWSREEYFHDHECLSVDDQTLTIEKLEVVEVKQTHEVNGHAEEHNGNETQTMNKNEAKCTTTLSTAKRPRGRPRLPNSEASKKKKISPPSKCVPNKCYVCTKVCENRLNLEEHLYTHKLLLPYKCADCDTPEFPMVFNTVLAVNRHLESHQFTIRCQHCPLRFRSNFMLQHHTNDKHTGNSDGFTCDHCGEIYHTLNAFREHVRKHQNKNSGRFRCEHCQRVFGSGALLRRHVRIHTGEKPFECTHCKKRFNHEDNFIIHKRLCSGQLANQCEVCKRTFVNATLLRYHMSQHYPEDPQYKALPRNDTRIMKMRYVSLSTEDGVNYYCCTIADCTFRSTTHQEAMVHRASHTKMIVCEHCNKRYTNVNAMRRHVGIAHGNFQLACNLRCHVCEKLFYSNQKLYAHIRSHKTAQYKCRFCDQLFDQVSEIVAHERTHAVDRPFHCGKCIATFRTMGGLRSHERTVHRILVNPSPTVEVNVSSGTTVEKEAQKDDTAKDVPQDVPDIREAVVLIADIGSTVVKAEQNATLE